MLDVEEDARACSWRTLPFAFRTAPSAGGCCCDGRSACAPCARRRRRAAGARPGRASACSSAAARAAGSSGGTTRPLSPSSSSSGTPEMLVETHTSPWLDASTSTLGRPSRSPSAAIRQASAKMSALAVVRKHLVLRQRALPGDTIGDAEFGRQRACSLSSSSPPPIWSKRQSRSAGSSASALSSMSKPFFSTARPTLSMVTGIAGSEPSRRSARRRTGRSGRDRGHDS